MLCERPSPCPTWETTKAQSIIMGSYTPEPSAPKESASAPFVLPDYPQGYARPLRVISVGGGASGLSTAYHIQKYLKNVDLTIYEKNSAIGGTWFENMLVPLPAPSHVTPPCWYSSHASKFLDTRALVATFPPTTTSFNGLSIQTTSICTLLSPLSGESQD